MYLFFTLNCYDNINLDSKSNRSNNIDNDDYYDNDTVRNNANHTDNKNDKSLLLIMMIVKMIK